MPYKWTSDVILWITGRIHALAITIALVSLTSLAASSERQGSLENDIASTYQYILGQELILNDISNRFPNLKQEVKISSLEFANNYGVGCNKLTCQLQSMLGDDFDRVIGKLKKQTSDAIQQSAITEDTAKEFLKNMSDRCKGKMPSPYIETLLIYQFCDDPKQEFMKSFLKSYSTTVNTKAHGVNLRIAIPISWRPVDGGKPNVIQTFVSNNGRGETTASISLSERPEGTGENNSVLDGFFSDASLGQYIPTGAACHKIVSTVLMGNQVGILRTSQVLQDLDPTTVAESIIYIYSIDKTVVTITFQQNAYLVQKSDLEKSFMIYEPLYRMIGESITFSNQTTGNHLETK